MSAKAISTSSFNAFSVTELSEGCKAVKADKSNEPFCFELFRRAIIDSDNLAWSAVYAQYHKLVYSWVVKATGPSKDISINSPEDFVIDTFSKFWNAFSDEHLARSENNLSFILAYLKRCAVTRVGEARRKQARRVIDVQWESVAYAEAEKKQANTIDFILDELGQEAIWHEIEQSCTDELDLIVARLGIVSNLKPKKILELHPDSFTTVREIYDRRRNLRDRLQRNPQLQSLLGLT